MNQNPLLVKRQPSSLDKLHHWNRRVWMELAIVKKRLEIVEEKTDTDTGGEFYNSPDENPWEPHIIYLQSPYLLPAFLVGMILGVIVTMVIMS